MPAGYDRFVFDCLRWRLNIFMNPRVISDLDSSRIHCLCRPGPVLPISGNAIVMPNLATYDSDMGSHRDDVEDPGTVQVPASRARARRRPGRDVRSRRASLLAVRAPRRAALVARCARRTMSSAWRRPSWAATLRGRSGRGRRRRRRRRRRVGGRARRGAY